MAEKIEKTDEGLQVPDEPIIPFIEGDGTGPDIWAASVRVFDAAVEKAYGGDRRIAWTEVLAGEKANNEVGEWLPEATIESFREHLVGIKGPLTTPVGEGFRSLNVAIRQILDLYVCLRPVRWYEGVPSPVKAPEKVDMVIFRENTEDVYAGKELQEGTDEARQAIKFFADTYGWDIRPDSGIGIKPISETGSKRLIRAAIRFALENDRSKVTLVHKGNIMKFTEGAFRSWGYELVREEFSDVAVSWEDSGGEPGDRLLVEDVIADAMLQQVLTRPGNYDVIATMNLNGDYISDALAAREDLLQHRHRPGRQHQLRDRRVGLRGHARHRAEVRRPGQGEPGLTAAVRRVDAAPHGVVGGRRAGGVFDGGGDLGEAGHV